jgi:segregation and condensation protein B
LALKIDADELDTIAEEMIHSMKLQEEGILLTRVGDKLQLCTNQKYSSVIKDLLAPDQHMTLSNAVMETLSIIAYRQPVTRAEIDEIRGVRSNYAISALVEKGLVRVVGKKDVLGRPSLFGTTDEFLRHFGISSLEELPELDLASMENAELSSEETDTEFTDSL